MASELSSCQQMSTITEDLNSHVRVAVITLDAVIVWVGAVKVVVVTVVMNWVLAGTLVLR